MKLINRFLLTSVLLVISIAAGASPSVADPTQLPHPEHSPLLPGDISASIRQRIQSIQPGMTRADLLRVFAEEGGAYPPGEREYVYGIPDQTPLQPQTLVMPRIEKTSTPADRTLPSLQLPAPRQPLFVNGQCIKVLVKFVSRDALLASLVNPSICLFSPGPSKEQASDVIVSVSEPFWGCITLD